MTAFKYRWDAGPGRPTPRRHPPLQGDKCPRPACPSPAWAATSGTASDAEAAEHPRPGNPQAPRQGRRKEGPTASPEKGALTWPSTRQTKTPPTQGPSATEATRKLDLGKGAQVRPAETRPRAGTRASQASTEPSRDPHMKWILRFIQTPDPATGSGTAGPGCPSPKPGPAALVECSKPLSVEAWCDAWRYAYGEMPPAPAGTAVSRNRPPT